MGLDYLRLCNFFLRMLGKVSSQNIPTPEGERFQANQLSDAWRRLDQPLSVVLRNFISNHWDPPHRDLALECVSLAREYGLHAPDATSPGGLYVITVLDEKLKPVRDALDAWKRHGESLSRRRDVKEGLKPSIGYVWTSQGDGGRRGRGHSR